MEEAVCRVGTVYPECYSFEDKGRAGVAKHLAEQIMLQSGFASPEQQVESLAYYRGEMSVFDRQAEACISLVFPSISEDDMLTWSQEKFMRSLAKAEWVMQEIWQMPFAFADTTKSPGEGTDEEQEEPKSLEEIGYEIRAEGGDPMVALRSQIIQKSDAGFVDFPMIGGPKLLENEEVLNIVREQIQRLPKR